MAKRSIVATIFTLSLMAITGCGQGLPETAAVHGKVMIGSKPVTEGMIVFYPSGGRSALGILRPDGTYQLTTFKTDDGALLGPHRVTIDASKTITAAAGPTSWEEELAMGGIPSTTEKIVWLVPAKYAELQTTTLTAEVKAGENEIDFNLPALEAAPTPQ